ncbi:anticodon-binding domain of tRNA-domain-containing protein [Baffinella frigidus]|nr:anticodon-binding domain of tRNA-domain-containing protein [Cryptophyta sp. CCMP2293]
MRPLIPSDGGVQTAAGDANTGLAEYDFGVVWTAAGDANTGLAEYDFASSTTGIYSFFLYELCDVYLELTKPVFGEEGAANGGTPAARAARAVLHHCLEVGMRLLHPFMPFVTEELWQRLERSEGDPSTIMVAKYPQREEEYVDAGIEAETKAMLDTDNGLKTG